MLGADPRPADGSGSVEVGQNDPAYHLFYRLIGTTPTGQPLSVEEGILAANAVTAPPAQPAG